MIFVADTTGAVSYVSPEWCAFTGQPAAEASGHGWFRCVHPQDYETAVTFLASVRDQRSEYCIRLRLRRADGSYAWVMIGAVPSFGPPAHTFLGYLGSVTQLSPSAGEGLTAYGTAGRYVPPPSHPATPPGNITELIADHLLIAHGLVEADSVKEALPGIKQALFAVGMALAREQRGQNPSAQVH
ncbi:PAS domain-containing protein [Methylobacterium sp. A54F]